MARHPRRSRSRASSSRRWKRSSINSSQRSIMSSPMTTLLHPGRDTSDARIARHWSFETSPGHAAPPAAQISPRAGGPVLDRSAQSLGRRAGVDAWISWYGVRLPAPRLEHGSVWARAWRPQRTGRQANSTAARHQAGESVCGGIMTTEPGLAVAAVEDGDRVARGADGTPPVASTPWILPDCGAPCCAAGRWWPRSPRRTPPRSARLRQWQRVVSEMPANAKLSQLVRSE